MSESGRMIYTMTGPNSFALQQALQKHIETFVNLHGDFGLERLDASQLTSDVLLESMLAMPFLAGKRLLIISDPGGNKLFTEKFPLILESLSDDTNIIFVQPTFDKRSSIYKFLKKNSDFLEFEELNEPALFRWISEYVEMHNGTISSADTRFLVSRIGSSQRTLQSELDKLLSYQSAISKEAIELLTVPTVQSSIFDLIDSAFAGRTTQTLDIYREQRMQKIEPLYIVAMITWQLHVIAIVKAGQGKSADTIARSAKINPYTVRKSSMLAQKMSMTQIKSLVSRTRDLERRLKRESIDSDEALLELLMHFN